MSFSRKKKKERECLYPERKERESLSRKKKERECLYPERKKRESVSIQKEKKRESVQGLSTFPITSRQLDHQKPLHNKKELAL